MHSFYQFGPPEKVTNTTVQRIVLHPSKPIAFLQASGRLCDGRAPICLYDPLRHQQLCLSELLLCEAPNTALLFLMHSMYVY